MIYHFQDKHANHYATDEQCRLWIH
jgi:hypothetical protein